MTNEKIHGIITRGVGGLYGVRLPDEFHTEILCRARGIFREEQITPTVGDDVLIRCSTSDDESLLTAEEA